MVKNRVLAIAAWTLTSLTFGQTISGVHLSPDGRIEAIVTGNERLPGNRALPAFEASPATSVQWQTLDLTCNPSHCVLRVRFRSGGADSARLSNVVPLQPGSAVSCSIG